MELTFKKLHPEAVAPTRANPNDAGLDLTAVSVEYNREFDYFEYDTGIAVEFPPGNVGFLTPRSSVSKTGLHLCNSIGTIDASYRGSIKARFYKNLVPGMRARPYEVGDKIGQLVIVPCFLGEAIEVKELSNTNRGENGFGSSGK